MLAASQEGSNFLNHVYMVEDAQPVIRETMSTRVSFSLVVEGAGAGGGNFHHADGSMGSVRGTENVVSPTRDLRSPNNFFCSVRRLGVR